MQKLRLIECGVGGIGADWLRNYTSTSPDFEIAAIVDVSEAALHKAGEEAGIAENLRFTSLETAIDAVEADAILTVTPPAVHSQHALLAFSRGLHVLTEKPIAGTLEEAIKMVNAARENGRQLVVAQQYRFRPPVQLLKSQLASNQIGELGHGHIDFYVPGDFTGSFRETMEFPLLVDMAIHHMDLIRCITGRNIVRVMANSFNPSWSPFRHDAGLKMLLELEGGIPFSYSGDWSAFGDPTGWNGAWRLQGPKGSLHMKGETVTLCHCDRWGANPVTQELPIPELNPSNQAQILASFAEAIRTGKPAETNGADNLNSFGAVIAGIQSIRENRPVDVASLLTATQPL